MLIWEVAAGEVGWMKPSTPAIEDNRLGFGGGVFPDFGWYSEGGLGGANFGSSGIMLDGCAEIEGKALV